MSERNLDWIYLARTPYWEERDLGKKYAILRKIKNKCDTYKGQYTWEAVSARHPEYPPKRLREIELSIVSRDSTPPIKIMQPLIEDLGLTQAEFLVTSKLKRNAPIVGSAPIEAAPQLVKESAKPAKGVKEEPREEPREEPKEKSSLKDMKVISHLSSAIVMIFKKGEIHIYDDDPSSTKLLDQPSSVWIGPADQRGSKSVEREFSLKGIKGL